MKNMVVPVLLLLCVHFSNAQSIERQVIASGGDYAMVDGLSLSFTIGELAILPLETSSLLLSQGFQQGELAISTSIQNPSKLQFLVYPNPTKGWVHISLTEKVKTSLKISILDGQGQLCRQQITSNDVEGLNLTQLPTGSYFILIENAQGKRGVTSIIKN